MVRLRSLVIALAASAVFAPEAHAIVGGTDVPPGERGYVAYITIEPGFACTGTLVAPTVVITAGHCSSVTGATPANTSLLEVPREAIEVTLGSVKRDDRDAPDKPAVAEVIVHPDYSFTNVFFSDRENDVSNDVAILRLAEPSEQTPVPIAAAAERDLWAPGKLAQIAGFWTTESGGDAPPVMQETEVPIADDAYSAGAYRSFEPGTQVGAGFPEGGKDSCQGDSGGPLLVPAADGSLRLVGDTSYGEGCAEPGKPGIYGRLADEKLRAFVAKHAPEALAPEPGAQSAPAAVAPSGESSGGTPGVTPGVAPRPTPTPGPGGSAGGGSGGAQPSQGGAQPSQGAGGSQTPSRLKADAAADRRRLRSALRSGLRLRIRCAPRCDAVISLVADRATARRAGLERRTIARGTRRGISGRRTTRLRFSRAARRDLRRASRATFTLRVVARGEDGQRRTITRRVELR